MDHYNNSNNELPSQQLLLREFSGSSNCSAHSLLTWSDISSSNAAVSSPYIYTNKYNPETHNRVAVILGYYNGTNYLQEQIRSILDQSHKNLEIYIADDCSQSEVDFAGFRLSPQEAQRIHLGVRSMNVGFTNNFLNALSSVDKGFEYFAFSDQDDVWNNDKISNALSVLAQYPTNKPALYCARTAITDANCQADLGSSPNFPKPPSFANALVQNICGGHTMVFNKAAYDLIVKSTKNTDVIFHDWWCYQIVSGAGGCIHYDPNPCLKYRQHSDNLFGYRGNWTALFVRIKSVLKGEFRICNDINLSALSKNLALITPANQRCLNDFIKARQETNIIKRLILFKRSGIYRQTLLGNLGLLLGIFINKV